MAEGNATDLSSLYPPDFYEWLDEGSQRSASEILPYVFDLCKPQAVCDIGCGTGTWLAVAKALGAREVLGFDGPHVGLEDLQIPQNEFIVHDLEKPLITPRRFDLAICLEVAEHLEIAYADELVQSLVQAAPIVLFSAAVPGQGGSHHVNCQWPSYWLRKFESHAYYGFDCIRPIVWDNPRVEEWYAQNIFLVISAALLHRFNGISAFRRSSGSPFLNIVHPKIFGNGIYEP